MTTKYQLIMKSKLKIKFTLTAASFLLLAACETPPKFDYVKEGSSQYDRTNALSECEYQVKLNKTPAAEQQQLRHLCMQGKGYRYKRVA